MITPEKRGFSSAYLESVLRAFDDGGIPMHSLLIARGDDIILNAYWAPFKRGELHRMNSVTKSFVALAIGCLIEEGRVALCDKVIDYFPEAADFDTNPHQAELTVENLLTMRTGYRPEGNGHWVRDREYNRIKGFFERKPATCRGESFYYDSTGSYILGVIVERLTGTSFIKYLQGKVLDKIGFSRNTDCIRGGEHYSWSDSGLLCSTEDLYKTAKFINGGGTHNGERLMSEDFLRAAVRKNVSTDGNAFFKNMGYGYQIWKTKNGGFMFLGMGAQIMLCLPDRDLYIVCTADTQPTEDYRDFIFRQFFDIIDRDTYDSLPEDPEAYKSLCEYAESLTLTSYKSTGVIPSQALTSGKKYIADENPMGIKWFSLDVSGERGRFIYENAQGEKEIPFGIGYNEFSDFPEDGYFDMEIGVSPAGHRYPTAVSAKFTDADTLDIWVQFIGRHLGGDYITVRVDGEQAHINMKKTTNCFLDRYFGEANAK